MSVQYPRPEFDSVVTSLYEAASLGDLWPEALDGLARLTGSRGALVTRPNGLHSGILYSPGLKDVVAQFFEQGWHRNDLRSQRLLSRPSGRFFRDQDITGAEERVNSTYYSGFARPAGVPWFAACGAIEPDGLILGVSIQRSAADGAFDTPDVERLARIGRHARAAVSFARRLATARDGERLEGLNRLDVAAMMLGADGRVRSLNALAERLVAEAHAVTIRGARVTSVQPAARRALEALLSSCCNPTRAADGPGPAVRVEGDRGAAYLVQAVPVEGAAHDMFGDGRAILTLTPIERAAPDAAATDRNWRRLTEAFSLTPAEARVAVLLAEGLEVGAISDALGVSQGAVRFHLKSILPKAGVSRQGAFVALAGSILRPF